MSYSYSSSVEYLYDEFKRLYFFIKSRINKARYQADNPDLKGLVITEEEIDLLLKQSVDEILDDNKKDGLLPEEQSFLTALEEEIAHKRSATLNQGKRLRLDWLAKKCQLTALDIDILLITLAPELDLRFERLYAYLQDDVTKKRPSIDLCIKLLCSNRKNKLTARKRFSPDYPLVKHRIIQIFADPNHLIPPLAAMYLKLDNNIINYLLEQDHRTTDLHPFATYINPRIGLDDLFLPGIFKNKLNHLLQNYQKSKKRIIIYFKGIDGIGKKSTAQAMCLELGINLLIVDITQLLETPSSEAENVVHRIYREAIMQNAALYWDHVDALAAENQHAWQRLIFEKPAQSPLIAFLSGNSSDHFSLGLSEHACVRIEFPLPSSTACQKMWELYLKQNDVLVNADVDLNAVAQEFKLTGQQIKAAASMAVNLAYWRDPQNHRLNQADIYAACRKQSSPNLLKLAKKITPRYTWDDIVLPSDQMAQLKEIYISAKCRTFVYETWGFEQKLSYGKGLNILFAGPSGTGKTMAADILAHELGVDLYKIDLSQVVSKYIGETEKNLSHVFDEAKNSNAILFFDEADALFGKRTEVHDAHDRYANIETGYLLQKMEEYDSITILATNLRCNMDEAFVRRIAFVVPFSMPNVEERLCIWTKIWPEEVPRKEDLDLQFMAKQFEIAGGNIKNIALTAAFMAAGDGRIIGMEHLILATRRELKKKGKMVAAKNFGIYWEYAF